MQAEPAGSQQEGRQLRQLSALRGPLLGAQGRDGRLGLDGHVTLAAGVAAPPVVGGAGGAFAVALGAQHPAAPARTPFRRAPPRPAPTPPAPPAARSGRRVARLISAEAAQSVLKPSADGRLPDLQLQEGASRGAGGRPVEVRESLVFFGVLALSVVISVVLAMVAVERPDSADTAAEGRRAAVHRGDYFGGGNIDRGDLKPYQIYLREAKRAHSSGDTRPSGEQYRKVLDLLHADRGEDRRGLTGSRTDDKKLEKTSAPS